MALAASPVATQETGSVIFHLPDGTDPNHWGTARMHVVGSNGALNWDELPGLGV